MLACAHVTAVLAPFAPAADTRGVFPVAPAPVHASHPGHGTAESGDDAIPPCHGGPTATWRAVCPCGCGAAAAASGADRGLDRVLPLARTRSPAARFRPDPPAPELAPTSVTFDPPEPVPLLA